MKVVINGKVYDSEDTPIILILGDDDKENISMMPDDAKMFCSYPEHGIEEYVEKLMEKYKGEIG